IRVSETPVNPSAAARGSSRFLHAARKSESFSISDEVQISANVCRICFSSVYLWWLREHKMPETVKLNSSGAGRGTPVVLLHGFPLNSTIWTQQRQELA